MIRLGDSPFVWFVWFVWFVVKNNSCYYSKAVPRKPLFSWLKSSYFCGLNEMSDQILYKDECYAIQGAIFEVNKELGCGFLEAVYQECLEYELALREIPFESQKVLSLRYKDHDLEQTYKADLVCYDSVLVELKAVREVTGEHRAQVINYLKASGLKLGLLVNFCHYPKATVERIVL